jgi:hypothetical protein
MIGRREYTEGEAGFDAEYLGRQRRGNSGGRWDKIMNIGLIIVDSSLRVEVIGWTKVRSIDVGSK